MSQDNYGYFGPDYSVADNILLPGAIGVRQESSFEAIFDAVGGVNYYIDTVAFGGPTFFDSQNLQPAGIRYFLNTEMRCSNGATMSEYMDGITRGDLLGDRVKDALASAGLPGLKGLAPGILENARDALDPRPLFDAVTASSYPVCQQVQCPVGDSYGATANSTDPTKKYIIDPVNYDGNGMPTQTRWVQAYDSDGDRISVTKDEFGAAPKCYNADGSYMTTPPAGCPASAPAALTATPSGTKYSLCTQLQPQTIPSAPESFADFGGSTEAATATAIAVGAVAALAAIGVWSFFR
jgi:hypothetical protein